MQHIKFTIIASLLSLIFFAACSSEDSIGHGDAGDSTETLVTFNIGATRSIQKPAISDDELITSYLIVVVKEGTVVKVITRSSLPAAEMHAAKARLQSGIYKVYAFANIPFNNIGDWLHGKFQEGQPMPDMGTLYYGDAAYGNGYSGHIPMSNSEQGLELNILPSKDNQTYGIEVVRMIAKVEFEFMNSSSEDIEVSEIEMGPLTKIGAGMTEGYIPLSWYDDSDHLRFFDTETLHCGVENYVHHIGTPISLLAGSTGDGKNNVVRFNVIESNPDPVSKQFHLRFRVNYNGIAEDRWALLDKSLVTPSGTNLDGDDDRSPFIRRNDWIHIPIDLGDYEFRLEAYTYPPIGGYPQVGIEEDNDEFKVTFSECGKFCIRPFIRKYGTTDWKYLDDTSVIESYTINVDTTSPGYTDIFKTAPAKQGNEIIGVIQSGAHGTALVTTTVNIKIGSGVTRSLTRKIYLKY